MLTKLAIIASIASGFNDADLDAIRSAISDRKDELPYVPTVAPKRSAFKKGISVWFNKSVSPKYMVGREAIVVKVNPKRVKVKLVEGEDTRFGNRPINCPLSLLSLTKV